MSVLILSCGRTGTNMILEIMRGSSQLNATPMAEDKQLFRGQGIVRTDYLSKCDTVYIDNFDQVNMVLDKNPHLKILWTIRDPRDTALSKIYRGQPGVEGAAYNMLADDATHPGCLEDLAWMKRVYTHIQENYPTRIKLVKMEDVILQFDDTIRSVCEFCEVPYEEEMRNFIGRYRTVQKAQRYKDLDRGQIEIYKRKYEIYGGFFKTHDIDLDALFVDLLPCLEFFGYMYETSYLENARDAVIQYKGNDIHFYNLLQKGNNIDRYILQNNLYKRADHNFSKILRLLKPNSVVYDIGAYIGTFSITMALEGMKVYAFEGFPDNFARAKVNCEPYNIDLHLCALSNEKSLVKTKFNDCTDADPVEREISYVIFDDYIEEKKLKKPDFIKLDIEGMETLALFGMRNILENVRPIWQIGYHIGLDISFDKYPGFVKVEDGGFDFKMFNELNYNIYNDFGQRVTNLTQWGEYICIPLEKIKS